MTLTEAYEEWGKQRERNVLYIKTRASFKRTWANLNMNTPCEDITFDMLGQALKQAHVVEVDRVRAASVMVHVLEFAHMKLDESIPQPNFTHSQLLRYGEEPKKEEPAKPITKKAKQNVETPKHDTEIPATNQETKVPEMEISEPKEESSVPKTEINVPKKGKKVRTLKKPEQKRTPKKMSKPVGRYPRPVAQLDPKDYKVIKVWDRLNDARKALNISNLNRALDNGKKAGGFYWCDADSINEFAPNKRVERKPVIKKDAKKKKQDTPAITFSNVAPKVVEPKPGNEITIPAGEPENEAAKFANTFLDTTDKAMIDELQRRGWSGELYLKIKNMTIKIEL